MLTEPQRRALLIIKEHGPIRPREFAKAMWPDAPGWKRACKCGPNGSTKGSGMITAGGAYLGRLRKMRLVRPSYDWKAGYVLSTTGRKALREAA